jgi:hypothetical protein
MSIKNTSTLFQALSSAYPVLDWELVPYEHSRNESKSAITFTHQGACIIDPTLSECGRFSQTDCYGLTGEHANQMRRHNLEYAQVTGSVQYDLDHAYNVIKEVILSSPNMNAREYLESMDFQEMDTGGACKAYYLESIDGDRILVTDTDGSNLPETLGEAGVGLYDPLGESVKYFEAHHTKIEDKSIEVESPNPLSIAGSPENTFAITSLILWLSYNIQMESEIRFSNEDEVLVQSEQALMAIKALLPKFAHLQA